MCSADFAVRRAGADVAGAGADRRLEEDLAGATRDRWQAKRECACLVAVDGAVLDELVGDGRDRRQVAADELRRVEPRVGGRVGEEVAVRGEGALDAALAVQEREAVKQRRGELDGLRALGLEHRVERAGRVDAEGAGDVLGDGGGELGGLRVSEAVPSGFSVASPHRMPILPALRNPADLGRPALRHLLTLPLSFGPFSITWLTEPSCAK
jgi:hypothetical protein